MRSITVVPLRDRNPIKITPYVTYGLIGLNIAVFLYEINLSPPKLEALFRSYAVIPKDLTASFRGIYVDNPISPILTLFTAQFLHGGILHLGGNMLYFVRIRILIINHAWLGRICCDSFT